MGPDYILIMHADGKKFVPTKEQSQLLVELMVKIGPGMHGRVPRAHGENHVVACPE